MRVLVTALANPAGISGVQRHALNLVRCLLHCPEITAVHLVLAPWQSELLALGGLRACERLRIEIAQIERSSLARNLWHLRDLPSLAARVGADLVQLSYPVPFLRAFMPCPVVMTLHDLYPFEIAGNFGFPQVIVNRWILRLALRQANAVSCVSRTTLRTLQTLHLRTPALLNVIRNCVEPGPPNSSRSPLHDWNGELFLLAVAQHRRNKNLDLLLRGFARLLSSGLQPAATRCVIVGMQGPETQALQGLAANLGIASRVELLEALDDEELHWCYRHCAALVATSSLEGFGLPVAEARLAGCRVVCSDIRAFRELAGPQVHFFELDGDAEFGLCRAITDALAEQRPAPEILPDLAVGSVASEYLELYRRTLAAAIKPCDSSVAPMDVREGKFHETR